MSGTTPNDDPVGAAIVAMFERAHKHSERVQRGERYEQQALSLAAMIAAETDIPYDDIAHELANLSPVLWPLVDSRSGCLALSLLIQAACGCEPVWVAPSVH
ncbi:MULTISPECIES: hypothetical protein [unclassified Sphingomonas]|uniref:hypothetical protein n=1 Tax=unclassified Sphingomonas TaxID=196159 RepID=UPI0006F57B3D|nr:MULTISPECIES: hypothetical protein [unclassified Sphingomonas]KQM64696.1 hypothetical protein ASE65_15615 [Sphingomonas sp. Leaf16]KQN16828.1 hypothetical protein ASE81_15665 [Sphingomonas sp. Leaf29]KQN22811.1 hypothetical protein ASE83_15595 [Sphingomonas sp. Leaf32]